MFEYYIFTTMCDMLYINYIDVVKSNFYVQQTCVLHWFVNVYFYFYESNIASIIKWKPYEEIIVYNIFHTEKVLETEQKKQNII